jgi:hypothetical protein
MVPERCRAEERRATWSLERVTKAACTSETRLRDLSPFCSEAKYFSDRVPDGWLAGLHGIALSVIGKLAKVRNKRSTFASPRILEPISTMFEFAFSFWYTSSDVEVVLPPLCCVS